MIEANADCGPVVYRGDNLPSELRGDVFINEPAGNLIRRQVFVVDKGVKSSRNAYDKAEFVASTDERFRPVNMINAPDGTLYVVDMYRGIIQHGLYITPYLRQQILERGLDKHIGLGRIFRVVHESTKPRLRPALGKASAVELIGYLSSSNGWHRDMAQQLLVGRREVSAVPALEKLAATGTNPLARLHALWTLEGLQRLDPELLFTLLNDKSRDVRASAVCLLRGEVNRQLDPTCVQILAPLASDPDPQVRLQLALTLGLVNSPLADRALEPILKNADPLFLEALLAGFAGRETELLAARLALPAWAKPEPWREKLLATSAGLLWRVRQPLPVLRFVHLVGEQPETRAWQQIALLEGLPSMPVKAPKRGFGKGYKAPPRVVTLPAVARGIGKTTALHKCSACRRRRRTCKAAQLARQGRQTAANPTCAVVKPPGSLRAGPQGIHGLVRRLPSSLRLRRRRQRPGSPRFRLARQSRTARAARTLRLARSDQRRRRAVQRGRLARNAGYVQGARRYQDRGHLDIHAPGVARAGAAHRPGSGHAHPRRDFESDGPVDGERAFGCEVIIYRTGTWSCNTNPKRQRGILR